MPAHAAVARSTKSVAGPRKSGCGSTADCIFSLTSATGPRRGNSVPATSSQSGRSTSPAQATKAPTPPPPPDPIAERGDRRWEEFESQSEDGRIAIFLETLEDAEVMSDSMAFEMLNVLHSDAAKRGDRPRFHELVGALVSGGPACTSKAHFYLSWCISDALGENRLDAVASLTRELAARAGVTSTSLTAPWKPLHIMVSCPFS